MNSRLKTTCYQLSLAALLLTSGCMVGPDYERPSTLADEGEFFYAPGQRQDSNRPAGPYSWWLRFGDATTGELVIEALAKNYDLKAAAARLLQAQAALAEAKGQSLPQLTYSMNRQRQKFTFDFGGGRSSALTTGWSQDFSVSYVLDFFGKLKRAERSAWADLLAAEANKNALVNSIIAQVINSRIEIATLTKRLQIARANVESRQKTLDIVERRYRRGLVGPVDVRLARENLAAAKATRTSIELSLIQARHSLDVLVGRRPASSPPLSDTLADLPQLEPVPIGLPASLLDRRPDVKAAEMALRSANERVGISIAQLYPDLTLTGTYGGSADTLRDIFRHESEVYSLVLNLAQPVFKGGQLRAAVEGAKARYQELAADYAKTVLVALKEVEDALVAEQFLRTQLEHTQLRFDEAKAAEQLSRQRYSRGVESILTVLESERRQRAAEEQLALLKGQRWTNRVNLFLALGGDWIADGNTKTAKSQDSVNSETTMN